MNHEIVPAHMRSVLAGQGLDIDSPDFRPLTKEQMMAKLD